MTETDFLRLVKPTFSYLSDEHADISFFDKGFEQVKDNVILPFTLVKKGREFIVDEIVTEKPELKKGDAIKSVDGILIEKVLGELAKFTTGFPDQRQQKAMREFGYLYFFAYPTKTQFAVKTKTGNLIDLQGVPTKNWTEFFKKSHESKDKCAVKISYQKIGNFGYIRSCSFQVKNSQDYNNFQAEIEKIFKQIKDDKVTKLIIDISQNDGGNSAIGRLLIDNFSNKPYKNYQSNWKRSDDYLKLMKSWGVNNPDYENRKPGEIIHYASAIYTPEENENRFQGKVYVLIGDETFSSAIMFGTLIKDSSLATLIGQTPKDGHPTHFGEMYGAKTPNLKLNFRFGVKEWIRPAGKVGKNILLPDIQLNLKQPFDIQEVIKFLSK